MAVVARRVARGKVYWTAFYDATGKQIWERVGTDKREAEALDRQRKREVADGTYARGRRPTMPFGEFLKDWASKRRNRNADEDRRQVDRYFLSPERRWLASLPCEELRPRHAVQLVEELKATPWVGPLKKDGQPRSVQPGRLLGTKFVANLYGLFRTAVRDARVAELIPVEPCVLPRGMLRRTAKRGTRAPYAWAEVTALITSGGIPTEGSTFAALAFFTGMREGEVCGRRWRDWDRESAPLGCLTIATQYDDRPLKTEHGDGEHPRKAPVHPVLASILDG